MGPGHGYIDRYPSWNTSAPNAPSWNVSGGIEADTVCRRTVDQFYAVTWNGGADCTFSCVDRCPLLEPSCYEVRPLLERNLPCTRENRFTHGEALFFFEWFTLVIWPWIMKQC